jgi:hypothetical protein
MKHTSFPIISKYAKHILVCIALLSFVEFSFGQKNKRPDWVDNVQSKYSDNLYIASLGVSDTHDGAKKRASAGIAERFKTKINVEQSYLQRYNSFTNTKGSTSESGTESIEKQIDTYANETLLNIAYGDFYTDNNGRVYVVGYIDRMKTAPIYANKIRKNDRQIDNYWTKGKQQTNPVIKYAYINAAYIISLYSEQLREKLAIIDQNSVEITIVSHGEIVDARTKAAADVKFTIAVENDEDDKVKAKISEVLTKSGFQVIGNEALADLNIKADIEFEDVNLDNRNLKFIGWTVNLDMLDNTENTLLSLNKTSRDGGKNRSNAVRMSYRSIYKYLELDFNKELESFFDNNIKKEDF